MAFVEPVTLSLRGVALVPLSLGHEQGLRDAAVDGELWQLRVTSVPEPEETRSYIEAALQMPDRPEDDQVDHAPPRVHLDERTQNRGRDLPDRADVGIPGLPRDPATLRRLHPLRPEVHR